MGIPHILAIPYPVQGHVNPLMQLCHILAKHGCKVTFLNTEFNQKRATTTTTNGGDSDNDNLNIRYVCLPDGLEPEDDRSDRQRVFLSIKSTMPNLLPKLIEDVNAMDFDNKITCLVVTGNMGWALEIGHNLGTKGAFLWTASATSMACCCSIPKLIDDGIIHPSDGFPIKKQEIQLSPQMPTLDAQDLPWLTIGNIFFTNLVQNIQTMKLGQWWLCNTAYDLEPGAFSFSQRLLPIGPLMDNNNKINSSFWQEDTTCLDWLDQQQPQSVVYVAFGSMVVLEQNQFEELALGLDLLKRPFLWVVRNDNNEKKNYLYPSKFQGSKGKIVRWAPQKEVLNHPSIACFISHCGWNSTMESVCSTVPFLCWPIFSDQFINRAYICGVWKVGLRLEKDENGLISKGEIKKKVEQVFGDGEMKERSMKLKELTMSSIVEGGQSPKNIEKFIDWAK